MDSHQATATPLGGYAAWASNPALGLSAGVNDGPSMDPDFDGIVNLLEFVLNGLPMSSSVAVLPALEKETGQWVFQYVRSDSSLPPATTQIVQYSINLADWTDIPVPVGSSGPVTITPGSPTDQVKVVIPSDGRKVYARLKVTP